MKAATAPLLTVTALSPVATASSFCRLAGLLWATVIVKATFELVHGEAARLVAAEDLIHADRAIAPGQSLLRARETAPHLPNAGVLLSGHACAPDGRAVSSMAVRLGLSRERPVLDKTLHVFGARGVNNPASIAPFQKMPLVYERALGGPGAHDNPVGAGGPGSRVYPNIVDPKDPRKVAGFGPISPDWAPRRGMLRGVDPKVLEASIWDVPAGFDWRFFQAAPQDQQIDRLHGDEWIVLDGMDPARPRVQSRLPEVTARARRRAPDSRGVLSEEDIELRADMLVIDADRGVASLLFRGRFTVDSLESLARVAVLVGVEQPGRPIAWPALARQKAEIAATMETQEVNLAAIRGASVPFTADRDSHLPAPSVFADRSTNEPARPEIGGTAAVDVQAILKGLLPFADLTRLAVPPKDPLPFESADPARPSVASLPTPASLRAPRMDTATADIDVVQILRNATPYDRDAAPAKAHDPPPPPVPPIAPPVVQETPVLKAPPKTPSPPIPALETPVLVAPPRAADPSPVSPLPPTPQEPSAPRINAFGRASGDVGALRARVMEKLANKVSLDGEDLPFANLSGLDLSGCSLVRCNLRGAKLRGAKLGGATLSRAVLDDADLRGAELQGANLSEASLVNADLEQANLTKASAPGADFRDARLQNTDLRGATMQKARFIGATMCGVQASFADFSFARLDRADLTDARLQNIIAKGAVLTSAKLDGADLCHANLEEANLHGWSTRRTRLAGANLSKTHEEAPEPSG